jgi:hypothetical protein
LLSSFLLNDVVTIVFVNDVLNVVNYLIKEHYEKTGIKLNACHPRDIIDQIVDIARYRGIPPAITREVIGEAWGNYFVEL